MFKIGYDKKITMVQGDTGVIRMKISNYELSQGDEVRFAIVNKANPSILLCQHSDKKIVLEKQVTVFERDGSARIVIYPYDTEYLQPGKYLYEIQVKTKDGRIDTVVPLTALTLMDGSIQGEFGQTTPSKPEPTPSEIELRFKRLENEIIPALGDRVSAVENEIDNVEKHTGYYVNILDFEEYVENGNWQKAYDEAVKSVGEGIIQFPKGEFYINTLLLKEGITVKGVGECTVLKSENDNIISVETLNNGYVYNIRIEDLKILGNNLNTGINLQKSTHVNLKNVLIYEVDKGIVGSDVWLGNFNNVIIRNYKSSGDIGLDIQEGTSITLTRCWVKNFHKGYNLHNVHYSLYNGCACDTFTEYAYMGCQAVTYNSCGAEDGNLTEGGFVFGSGARSCVLNGCESLNSIKAQEGVIDSSYFYFNGSRVTISGHRLPQVNNTDVISIFRTESNAIIILNASTMPTNYKNFITFNNDYAALYEFKSTGITKHHRVNPYVIGATNSKGYETNGYNATYIGNHVDGKIEILGNKLLKNSYSVATTDKLDIIEIIETSSKCQFTLSFDIHINTVDKGYSNVKAYVTFRNGEMRTPVFTVAQGYTDHELNIALENNILSLTNATPYSSTGVDVIITQKVSSGNIKFRWK